MVWPDDQLGEKARRAVVVSDLVSIKRTGEARCWPFSKRKHEERAYALFVDQAHRCYEAAGLTIPCWLYPTEELRRRCSSPPMLEQVGKLDAETRIWATKIDKLLNAPQPTGGPFSHLLPKK